MTPKTTSIRKVPDTAFWVATYRAMESARKDALFRDPLAGVLTGVQGRQVARSMKPFQRYAYWSITIRTVLIDEVLREQIDRGCKTVINLGAGLDTWPYRLDLPPDLHWIEVDFPEVVAFKNDRLAGHNPNCGWNGSGRTWATMRYAGSSSLN